MNADKRRLKTKVLSALICVYLRPIMLFSQPATVKQIVPGVWFREGVPISRAPARKEEMGNPNAIIIEMKDYLIVVDANFPSGARLVMQAAREVSPKPVKYVFLTHHHGDHSYGSVLWTRAGATTLAYVGVAEEMKRYEPMAWQAAAKTRKDVADLNLPAPEPPRQTFVKSPYVLDDGRRRVEFHYFGWAHTRGDGFVFLPKEKVICTGDALASQGINFLGNANIWNWNNVLKKAQALGARYVLPGHGPAAGPEVFDGQMLFFTELLKAVQRGIDSGRRIEDLVHKGSEATAGFGGLTTTLVLPASVQNWVSDLRLPMQVRDTYEELRQNKPRGAIELAY